MTTQTGSRIGVAAGNGVAQPIGAGDAIGADPYDPLAYWQAVGRDPGHREHETRYVRTEVFARQEETLMSVLSGLEFGSVLEVGCGWGRITRLVAERWPDGPYVAIDLSRDRLMSAKRKAPGVLYKQAGLLEYEPPMLARFDLVLAVEVLMHVPPPGIAAAVDRLCELSARYVVSVDWAVPLAAGKVIAPWNALYDYPALYGSRLVSVTQTDRQAVFVADVRP